MRTISSTMKLEAQGYGWHVGRLDDLAVARVDPSLNITFGQSIGSTTRLWVNRSATSSERNTNSRAEGLAQRCSLLAFLTYAPRGGGQSQNLTSCAAYRSASGATAVQHHLSPSKYKQQPEQEPDCEGPQNSASHTASRTCRVEGHVPPGRRDQSYRPCIDSQTGSHIAGASLTPSADLKPVVGIGAHPRRKSFEASMLASEERSRNIDIDSDARRQMPALARLGPGALQ